MTREADLARRAAEIRKFFRQTVTSRAVVSQYLQDAEEEMERLQTAIYALQSKRNRLKATTDLYRSLLSPIHSMPSEILTTVFAFYFDENVLSREQLPAAIQLSMVCGRWRDIVRSTPSLWSSISIDFVAWTKDFHVLNQLTECFMEQSKQSPLKLSIHFPEASFDDPESDVAQARPALNILVQHCSRWESVNLLMFPAFHYFNILAPIRGHLPSLKYLSLFDPDTGGWVEDLITIFDSCPLLRRLAIRDPLGPLEKLPLPWAQLIVLALTDSYGSPALEFLSRCPGVEQLSLSHVGDVAEGEEDYDGHVISDKVKSLAISHAEEQCEVDDILRHSTFSKMTALTVGGNSARHTKEWPAWDGTHLEAFILRSSCIVTTLQLKTIPITDTQTLSLLQLLSTLESLEIEEYLLRSKNQIVTKPFLDGLASSNLRSADPILPRLSNMKLLIHAHKFDPEALLQVLAYRWLPDAGQVTEVGIQCLRFVMIVVFTNAQTPPQDRDALDCLRCFKKAGMNLKVTCGDVLEFYPHLKKDDT
ncbi:hypothetical protein L218DRAFT_493840 [Marasmius fiardii PR-910]|nr:hypothetical protein L218DRAFT_493840 [Marasmius fiardii PR-910]